MRLHSAISVLYCHTFLEHGAHLEAEFKDQSAIYYTLQALLSQGWLRYTKKYLIESTNNESICIAPQIEADVNCSDCFHARTAHDKVPASPWHLDQRDTYLASRKRFPFLNASSQVL